jgi:hypothetical protein
MTEKRKYTWSQEHLARKAARDALVNETYLEIGETMAQAILEGGKSEQWVWELVGSLGVYERWMIKKWLSRYRAENRPRLRWRKFATERMRRKRRETKEKIKDLSLKRNRGKAC